MDSVSYLDRHRNFDCDGHGYTYIQRHGDSDRHWFHDDYGLLHWHRDRHRDTHGDCYNVVDHDYYHFGFDYSQPYCDRVSDIHALQVFYGDLVGGGDAHGNTIRFQVGHADCTAYTVTNCNYIN